MTFWLVFHLKDKIILNSERPENQTIDTYILLNFELFHMYHVSMGVDLVIIILFYEYSFQSFFSARHLIDEPCEIDYFLKK